MFFLLGFTSADDTRYDDYDFSLLVLENRRFGYEILEMAGVYGLRSVSGVILLERYPQLYNIRYFP
jgi:hypothetical protein